MNNANTPKSNIIVPLFLLSGLLTIIGGCSYSESRPEAAAEPTEPVVTEIVSTAPIAKKEIRIKASHPRQYTVKKDDTLWDISALFLQDPWYWPEIWRDNSQIKNPHLIFPGDVLTLVYVNGQPRMRVNDAQHKAIAASNDRVKKLSPTIRTTALEASIPSIPGDAIRQFLTRPRVVTKEQLDEAPYVVGGQDKHLILGSGSRIYISGELDKERVRFAVFNPGDELRDPETNELLGYEAKYAGDVRITAYGNPSSGDITYSSREILIGDRLLSEDRSKRDNQYFPHVPDSEVNAQIISLYDALFGVAQYQIVVINRGERDGIEVGHVLATFSHGNTIRDNHDFRRSREVKLPNERSGLVMIFKTFERVSYALTMESERVIHKNDAVQKPKF
jgi:hypothetical protein